MTNALAEDRYFALIEATLRAGLAERSGSRAIENDGEISVERALPIVAQRFGFRISEKPFPPIETATKFVDGAGNTRPIYASVVAGATNDAAVGEYVSINFGPLIESLAEGSLTIDARHGTDVAAAALAARVVARGDMGEALMPRKTAVAAIQRIVRRQQLDGTFLARTDADAPEPRWYDELAVLHALSCFATEQDDAEVAAAVTRAVKYHAAETQPDHASNHPWAIAAFLAEPMAIPLADMMLHAAGVQSPRTMDAVSLLLLADALDCGRRRTTHIM